MSVKVIGVEGERLPQSHELKTQDIIGITLSAIALRAVPLAFAQRVADKPLVRAASPVGEEKAIAELFGL